MTNTGRSHLVSRRVLRSALTASALVMLAAAPVAAAPPRTVTIDDANGDGRYTGADVDAAIARCKPGCVLQALPVTYDDVQEAWLGPGMPDGVIFQGAGVGKTIFRAPVPQLRPVIRVSEAPPNVVLRDFTVDGRMSDQTSPALAGDCTGIAIASLAGLPSPPGTIERVELANLLGHGIYVRNASGWEIRDNLIHDIGCDLRSPCPNIVRPPPAPYIDSATTYGVGIVVVNSGANGTVVHHNTIWNLTKMGIAAYHYAVSGQPPSDFWFHHNTVRGASGAAIGSNGGVNGRIEDNLVEANGGPGIFGNSGAGVFCSGTASNVAIDRNTVRGNEGPGLRLSCRGPISASANVLQGNCRKPLGNFGEINAGISTDQAKVVGWVVGLSLSNNTVLRGADGGGCPYALVVGGWSDVLVDGGTYQGGDLGVLLGRTNRITFRNLSIHGGAGAGIHIAADVNGVNVESTVQISHPNGPAVNNTGAQNVTVAASEPVAPPAAPGPPGRPVIKVR